MLLLIYFAELIYIGGCLVAVGSSNVQSCAHVKYLNNARFKNPLRIGLVNYVQLVTAVRLDREAESNHVVTITCRDYGTPALTSNRTVRVHVVDVNDCPPTFSQASYTGLYNTGGSDAKDAAI